jgi:hypothetical protein
MKRMKKLNGVEVVVEKPTSKEYEEIMQIVDQMTTLANKKEFNMILNATSLFMCDVFEMTNTTREEAERILANFSMSVMCRCYDVGDESPLQ